MAHPHTSENKGTEDPGPFGGTRRSEGPELPRGITARPTAVSVESSLLNADSESESESDTESQSKHHMQDQPEDQDNEDHHDQDSSFSGGPLSRRSNAPR